MSLVGDAGYPLPASGNVARGGPLIAEQLASGSIIMGIRALNGSLVAFFDENGKLILPGSATDDLHALTRGEALLRSMLTGNYTILANDGSGNPVSVPTSTNDVLGRAGGAVTSISVAPSEWVGRKSSGNLGGQPMSDLVAELLAEQSGATFPATPTDGQRFYHTTHEEWFRYSTTDSGWLAETAIDVTGSLSGNATGYLWLDNVSIPFSATIGYKLGFDVKVKELHCFALSSSTCTYVVRANGTDVSGASVSLSSSTTGYGTKLASGTITSGQAIAIAVTSGTANGGSVVRARLRRFET